MDIKSDTLIKDICIMVWIHFTENVSYKVYQLARLGLQGGDISTYRIAFEMLPIYIAHLH